MVPLGLKLPLGRGMALALVIAHVPSPPWIRPPSGAWHDSGTRETLTPELRGRQQVRVGCVKGLDDIPAADPRVEVNQTVLVLLGTIDKLDVKAARRDARLLSHCLSPIYL